MRSKHKQAKLNKHLHRVRKRAHKEKYISKGVQWLAGYGMILGLFMFLNFLGSFFVSNPVFMKYPGWRLVDAIFLVVLGFTLYGMYHREAWSWRLGLVWFFGSVLYLIVGFMLLQNITLNMEFSLLAIIFIFLIANSCLCFWYLYQKKPFFYNPFVKGTFTAQDHVFVGTLLLLLVLLATIGLTVWRFG